MAGREYAGQLQDEGKLLTVKNRTEGLARKKKTGYPLGEVEATNMTDAVGDWSGKRFEKWELNLKKLPRATS